MNHLSNNHHYLCREVVNSRKAVNKIYAAKANLNSVQMQMKTQLAQVTFLSISIEPFYRYHHISSEVIWRNKLQPLKFVRKELVTRVGIFRPKLRALSQAAPMWWRPCSSWFVTILSSFPTIAMALPVLCLSRILIDWRIRWNFLRSRKQWWKCRERWWR